MSFVLFFHPPTCDWDIWPRLLLSPRGNKHSDIGVSSIQEEVDRQLDSQTREHLFVAVAERTESRESNKKSRKLK